MKKTIVTLIIICLTGLFLFPSFGSADDDDIRMIRKAVQEKPASRKPSQWLKIEVVNTENKKELVKITLPLKLIEMLLNSMDDCRIKEENVEIDLQEIFNELKRGGPSTLIEVKEGPQMIKVWLE